MRWNVTMTIDFPAYSYTEQDFAEIGAGFTKKNCKSNSEIIEFAGNADSIITVATFQSFPGEVIRELKNCRLIASLGIGYEGIDVQAATEYGICVSNVADYCLEEVSDHAITLLLCCARQIFHLDRAVRNSKWTMERMEIRKSIWPHIPRIKSKTLGVVGLGKIARTLVPKAKGLGMNVVSYDPYVSREVAEALGVRLVAIDELCEISDFISIHTPLTAETRKLIGREQIKKMKKSAYIINTARGDVIDQTALIEALRNNDIAGAALDVLSPEPPPPDDPIFSLDNVILTAHSALASAESTIQLKRTPVEEIIRLFKGKWPNNFVNPEVKEGYLQKWGKLSSV